MDLDALADHHLEQHQNHANVEPVELATSISELTLPKDQSCASGPSFLRQALMATTSQSFSR